MERCANITVGNSDHNDLYVDSDNTFLTKPKHHKKKNNNNNNKGKYKSDYR